MTEKTRFKDVSQKLTSKASLGLILSRDNTPKTPPGLESKDGYLGVII